MKTYHSIAILISIISLIISAFSFIKNEIIWNKKLRIIKQVDKNNNTVLEIINDSNKTFKINEIQVNDEILKIEDYRSTYDRQLKKINDENGLNFCYADMQNKNILEIQYKLPHREYDGYIAVTSIYTFVLYKNIYNTAVLPYNSINFQYFPHNTEEYRKCAMVGMDIRVTLKVGGRKRKLRTTLSPNIIN